MKTSFAKAILLLSLLVIAASAFAWPNQLEGEQEYAGTINNTIRIRMKLSRSGNRIRGTYFYEKVGKALQLSGSASGDQVTLKETDQSGNQTGIFKGRFVNESLIEGTWSNADGTKTYPFSVKAASGQPGTRTPQSGDAISGQYKRVNAKGKLDYHGAAINVQLLKDGRARVQGDASWVGNPNTGNVNVGSIDGTFALEGSKVMYKDGDGEYDCRLTITFDRGYLTVTEDNGACGGHNVSFDGKYKRFGPPKFEDRN